MDADVRETQEHLGIGVLAKAGVNCFGEVFTGLAGCFELLQQSEKLLAEGVLDGDS
ncbi:hypothetical protein [Streptomyces sp. NPDC056105]|uniref:hypothetical protein n=1 Tax=Streptomyces sp. NPDC056105 TaxID=3345714 RepID=UPI0035DAB685